MSAEKTRKRQVMRRVGWSPQCISLVLLVWTAGTGGDDQTQAEAQSVCAQGDAACFRALAEARLQRIRQLEDRLASCKAASTDARALSGCQQRDDARAPGDASCASPGALRSAEPWLPVAGVYNDDMSTWYKEAIRSIEHYNRFGPDAWSPKGQAVFERLWNPPLHSGPSTAERQALGIKAYVTNHDRTRRAAVQWMVELAGFVVAEDSFPPTRNLRELDHAHLLRSGLVSEAFADNPTVHSSSNASSERRLLMHAAHGLDYLDAVAAALESNETWAAIFEDDIMLSAPPRIAQARLRAALERVSAVGNADALYMEYCFDHCEKGRYQESNPWVATAAEPYCAAAILFSASGLRKIARLFRPVFAGVDDMMARLCKSRALNCYKMRQPIFTQDMVWGSAFTPLNKRTVPYHDLDYSVSLCREVEGDVMKAIVDEKLRSEWFHLLIKGAKLSPETLLRPHAPIASSSLPTSQTMPEGGLQVPHPDNEHAIVHAKWQGRTQKNLQISVSGLRSGAEYTMHVDVKAKATGISLHQVDKVLSVGAGESHYYFLCPIPNLPEEAGSVVLELLDTFPEEFMQPLEEEAEEDAHLYPRALIAARFLDVEEGEGRAYE